MKKFLKTMGITVAAAALNGAAGAAFNAAESGKWGKPVNWGSAIAGGALAGIAYCVDPNAAARKEAERNRIRLEK